MQAGIPYACMFGINIGYTAPACAAGFEFRHEMTALEKYFHHA
jgi:hypothetical protein